MHRAPAARWAIPVLCLLLSACGGDSDPSPEPGSTVDLPPAGLSRWAALEQDLDADGSVDLRTRYHYDARGIMVMSETFEVSAGVEAATPRQTITWTPDAAGRITDVVDSNAATGTTTTWHHSYGADGRLTGSLRTMQPAGLSTTTTYEWEDGLLVGSQSTTGSSTTWATVAYGEEGRVSVVVFGPTPSGGYDEEHRYVWHDDGRLAYAEFSSGKLDVYRLGYDADGRHASTLYTDDGVAKYIARLAHDARGRLERVEQDLWPDTEDPDDMVVERIHVFRWEDGPCQPVHLPQLPPTFDRQVTGDADAANVSAGCGP